MCRLLSVRSNQPVLIQDHLQLFASLCQNSKENQGHGWGIAYQNSQNQWQWHKDINPIWECRHQFEALGSSTLFLAHARSAFQDKDIVIENNMPFEKEPYIYMFNGELRGVKINMPGRIGAEKIFNQFLQFNKNNPPAEAFDKTYAFIEKKTDYIRAMNIILLKKDLGSELFARSDFNEDPDYFTMHYYEDSDTLIICSDPYPNLSGWQPIQKGRTYQWALSL